MHVVRCAAEPPGHYTSCNLLRCCAQVRINTPIKQHVFGKSGAYMCILEEQRVRSCSLLAQLPAPCGLLCLSLPLLLLSLQPTCAPVL